MKLTEIVDRGRSLARPMKVTGDKVFFDLQSLADAAGATLDGPTLDQAVQGGADWEDGILGFWFERDS